MTHRTITDAINDVARDIADHIKPGLDARDIAERLVFEKDVAFGDDVNIEVPASCTQSGRPFTTTVDGYFDGY